MRTLLLLSLAASAMTAVACRPASDDARQTAFQVPKRDLTLQQADAPKVEVASPVELGQVAPPARQTSRHQRKARTATRPQPAATGGTEAEQATADASVESPAAAQPMLVSQASYEAPDPNALAPGQTVTVLPASNGAANEPGLTDQGPPDAQQGETRGTTIHAGGHGGHCGGRGGGRPGGGANPGLR